MSLLVLTLMGGILLPSEASCRMNAEADLSYVDFDARNKTQHISASSFTQHYSVLYDTSGKFASGRLGKYDVSLGLEWLAFDTDIKSSAAASKNLGESRAHIFYQGEVVLDPREIPFRLKLFSRDLNLSQFVNDQVPGLSNGNDLDQPAVSSISSMPVQSSALSHYISVPSDVSTSILNGTHIESGATLVMGVKNGMTNGYNETLRHFPMLMLDYRDLINRDLKSIFPEDNRLTRLAFVSLNKKDNWFHYRYFTYNDYLDAGNNYSEAQVQLGTVDHMLARRWIDFTNWMKVSVDGQFTKRMQAKTAENYEEFSLNLFGTARRESWELRSFNNFTRLNEYNRDRLTYSTSLPVYANGIISPTASWNAYAKYNDNHTVAGEYFNTAAGGYSMDTFRKSPFTLSQGLGAERVTTSAGSETLILSGTLGTTSTPYFSRDLLIKASYDIRSHRYSNNVSTSSFIDQVINGTVGYNLNNTLRIIAEQTNRFTTGTSQYLDTSIPGSAVTSTQYISPLGNAKNPGGSGYESKTNLRIAWTPKPRLNIGFLVSEDIYVPQAGERVSKTRMDARVEYTTAKLKLSSSTAYIFGDSYDGEATNQLSSTNTLNYIFSRSLDAKVGFTYFRTYAGGTNQIDSINAEQALNYTYYQDRGMRRKIFEINEIFTSVDEYFNSSGAGDAVISSKQRVNTLMIGTKYYPLRQTMIAGGARYSFVNGFENDAINYYGSLSVHFRLLEAGLEYTYGKNKVDNRVEKKFMANVKKRF